MLFVSVSVEYIASCTDKFIGTIIIGGCLFPGELLFHAKADGFASSTQLSRPIPKFFLNYSLLKCREQTFVASVIVKCLCKKKLFFGHLDQSNLFDYSVEHSNTDSGAIFCYS